MDDPQISPPRPQVLVVDDEPRNVEVVSQFLELEGFRVTGLGDGESALQAIQAAPPDVILLDVMMPGPDGFEVCRRLKADPRTVFIPVVILTALRGTSERIKGAAAGADDFLSKPFDHVELVTRVKSLVRVKQLHDQVEAHARELEARVAERTDELQRALRQLRELDRLKSEFIANVSHELRTPLLHVKGYVGLIADGALGPFTPEQAHGIRVAQKAIDQLERVVQDIVDFRNAQERRLSLERVALTDTAHAAVEALAEAIAARQAVVRVDIPPDTPLVQADRSALLRVLRHLVDNAVKFGPSGVSVEIRAETRRALVRVVVQDRGPGISPERQAQIFDPFYQTDGSSTRTVGGMGLGLALVRALLEAHGSAIQLESALGQGSTFYFDLPAAER